MTYHLAGKTVGRIRIISKAAHKDHRGKTLWNCICSCGNEFTTVTNRLTDSNKKRRQRSCGNCQWHIKHPEAYNSWQAMLQRCLNINNKDYPEYGGRGIIVSGEWHEFIDFYVCMGDPPKDPITGERLTLERKDVNGNYEPNNCKWATRSEQQLNKRNTMHKAEAARAEGRLL